MKIGIKLWSEDLPRVEEFVDAADFMEIMIEPDFPYRALKEYDIPYTIHAPHHKFDVNIADQALLDHNLRTVNQATEAADFLGADWIIVHPGELFNKGCSLEAARVFLERIADDRIVLENMPYLFRGKPHLAHTPEEMGALLDLASGICLDFAHAVVTKPGEDAHELIESFAKMEPKIFHISDGHKAAGHDEHLALGDGNLELDYFKGVISQSDSKKVTIETPPNRRRHMEEIEFLKK